MSVSATLVRQVSGLGDPINTTVTYTEEASKIISAAIATDQTDYQISFDLDVSEIEMIIMVADQNMTIETNNGAAPDETIALIANEPYIWTVDDGVMGLVNALATDLTDLYVTNTTAGTLNIRCVYDPTP